MTRGYSTERCLAFWDRWRAMRRPTPKTEHDRAVLAAMEPGRVYADTYSPGAGSPIDRLASDVGLSFKDVKRALHRLRRSGRVLFAEVATVIFDEPRTVGSWWRDNE